MDRGTDGDTKYPCDILNGIGSPYAEINDYTRTFREQADCKYFDTCSYSNVFVEKIAANTMLVLYNNSKYDEGDGVKHKTAFVRTVTFVNE